MQSIVQMWVKQWNRLWGSGKGASAPVDPGSSSEESSDGDGEDADSDAGGHRRRGPITTDDPADLQPVDTVEEAHGSGGLLFRLYFALWALQVAAQKLQRGCTPVQLPAAHPLRKRQRAITARGQQSGFVIACALKAAEEMLGTQAALSQLHPGWAADPVLWRTPCALAGSSESQDESDADSDAPSSRGGAAAAPAPRSAHTKAAVYNAVAQRARGAGALARQSKSSSASMQQPPSAAQAPAAGKRPGRGRARIAWPKPKPRGGSQLNAGASTSKQALRASRTEEVDVDGNVEADGDDSDSEPLAQLMQSMRGSRKLQKLSGRIKKHVHTGTLHAAAAAPCATAVAAPERPFTSEIIELHPIRPSEGDGSERAVETAAAAQGFGSREALPPQRLQEKHRKRRRVLSD